MAMCANTWRRLDTLFEGLVGLAMLKLLEETYCDYLHALLRQSLRGWLSSVTGDGADLERFGQHRVGQDCTDYGAALDAGCAKYGQKFRHDKEDGGNSRKCLLVAEC